MAKCNDCWCEHYDKNKGNCDQCQKKAVEKDKADLGLILKKLTVRQMELDKKSKVIEQRR